LRKAKVNDLDPALRGWNLLSTKEKVQRKQVLEVLRGIRKGESLAKATKRVGLSNRKVRKYLDRFLVKKRGRWQTRETDRIQRGMIIYERNVGKTYIIVRNSKDASTIGEYFSMVGHALETGDPSFLKKFKKIAIKDVEGKKHKLETDLGRLYELQDEAEDTEFFEIYKDG